MKKLKTVENCRFLDNVFRVVEVKTYSTDIDKMKMYLS
jgi:hypothetical protein